MPGIRPELPTGGLIIKRCKRDLFEYRYNHLIYNLKFIKRIFLARGYGYHVTKPLSAEKGRNLSKFPAVNSQGRPHGSGAATIQLLLKISHPLAECKFRRQGSYLSDEAIIDVQRSDGRGRNGIRFREWGYRIWDLYRDYFLNLI